jgi:hypothetical protein
MTLDIESIIEAVPALVSFGVLIFAVYIVTSNDGDDDNLSTP